MFNRYDRIQRIKNNSIEYRDFLRTKNLKNLEQYTTFSFGELKDINTYGLESVLHVVQPFEKLYNISQKYYGSPEYGWLICYTNKIANEMLINTGTGLKIYLPLQGVLGLF